MAPVPPETFKARKARLRAAFLEQLPQRLHAARALLTAPPTPAGDRAGLVQLHLVLHTVKGSAASFGLTALSELAREGDELLQASLTADAASPPGLSAALAAVLERLESLALGPAAPADQAEHFAWTASSGSTTPTAIRPAIRS